MYHNAFMGFFCYTVYLEDVIDVCVLESVCAVGISCRDRSALFSLSMWLKSLNSD